jgi:hypothetical protein
MAKPRLPRKSVKMAEFASAELDRLVDELSTPPAALKVNKEDLAGALVLAARRSPIEATRAIVHTYWDREKEELAKLGPGD